jgi:predicted Zn-dependent protease with MMP-like domain
MNFKQMVSWAEQISAETLKELPLEVRTALDEVPIFFEALPSEKDIDEGIALDTLGLFDPGPDAAPMACIRLWLENIWDEAEEAGTTFEEEVRITLLHEIGHLLGWDEDEVEDRGLA